MSLTTGLTEGTTALEMGDLARITVDQYEELARLGTLADPGVELVNGLLVRKTTKSPRHSATVMVIEEVIRAVTPEGWHVRVEQPVRLPEHDEPEPDLAIVRGNAIDYLERHPGPADVALVVEVEVAAASLRIDRGDKLRAYSRGGIPAYWIVNLIERRVEVYGDPVPEGYASLVTHEPSSDIVLTIAGQERGRVVAGDLLPEPRTP